MMISGSFVRTMNSVTTQLPKWCVGRSVLFWLLPLTEVLPTQTEDSSDSDETPLPLQAQATSSLGDQFEGQDEAPSCQGAFGQVLRSVLDRVLDDSRARRLP